MTSIKLSPRWKRRFTEASRNAPLFVLVTGLVLAIETLSAGGIFATNQTTLGLGSWTVRLAWVEAFVSIGCGLLASWGSMSAAAFKADPRPVQKRRAGSARLLAIALVIPPVVYLGNSLAFTHQHATWEEWSGSESEAAARAAVAADPLDSIAREELEKSIEPTTVQMDGTWFLCLLGAAFLHGAIMLAAGTFYRPKPETEAEANRRFQEYKRLKARERRQAAKKAKEKMEPRFKGIPNVSELIRTGRA